MQINSIHVDYQDEDRINKAFDIFTPEPVDKFLNWLVVEGFYDDIQATKRFSTSREVMNRLKGKR